MAAKGQSRFMGLPSLDMIFPWAVVGREVGPGSVFRGILVSSLVAGLVILRDGCYSCAGRANWSLRAGIFLKVFHVVGSVTTLKEGIGCRTLLLAFPKKMSAKGLGELSCKHVSTGGAR